MTDLHHPTHTELALWANQVRQDIVTMTASAGSGHPGGSLSSVEILVALYFAVMRLRPGEPAWDGRDIFLLSKGHITPAFYSVLARRGYFDPALLPGFRSLGSPLQGHPSKASGLPGVEVSSGSLGQGLSVGLGFALSFAKLDRTGRRVYVLMGDGEMQEGSVWEALMAAGHYRLSNLCAVIDNNGLQIDGPVEKVMNIEPLADKLAAFGWQALTVDGHDFPALLEAFAKARTFASGPTAIIARTVKGKGIGFMEGQASWHGKAPSAAQAAAALAELAEQREALRPKGGI